MAAVVIVSALSLAAGFLICVAVSAVLRDRAHSARTVRYGPAAARREWTWLAWFAGSVARARGAAVIRKLTRRGDH